MWIVVHFWTPIRIPIYWGLKLMLWLGTKIVYGKGFIYPFHTPWPQCNFQRCQPTDYQNKSLLLLCFTKTWHESLLFQLIIYWQKQTNKKQRMNFWYSSIHWSFYCDQKILQINMRQVFLSKWNEVSLEDPLPFRDTILVLVTNDGFTSLHSFKN